jgi:hypothetical protein
MLKKILAALALLGACLVPVAAAAPATAGNCSSLGCGSIYHYSPDDGFDGPFLFRCNYGDPSSEHWLHEGWSSKSYCADLDQIYISAGNNIMCKAPWSGWFNLNNGKTGWFKIYDTEGYTCVHQRD